MIQDVSNLAFIVGYTARTWTLGAQMSWRSLFAGCYSIWGSGGRPSPCLTWRTHMRKVIKWPLLNLSWTYVKACDAVMPRAGDRGLWVLRDYYHVSDLWFAKYGWLN